MLAKCPRCGSKATLLDEDNLAGCTKKGCGYWINPMPVYLWNWTAKKVRKGRMFEWLEQERLRRGNRPKTYHNRTGYGRLNWCIRKARDWWKKRKRERKAGE